jgi:hypothetical protein
MPTPCVAAIWTPLAQRYPLIEQFASRTHEYQQSREQSLGFGAVIGCQVFMIDSYRSMLQVGLALMP